MSFRLLTTGSPEEWPRKCYPLKCPSIPLDPSLFISLRFFSRLDESSRTCLLANSEKRGEIRSHTSNRKLFSQRTETVRICEVTQCILPPFPSCFHEKFFRTPVSGQHGRTDDSKTSLRAVDVRVGVDVGDGVARERNACEFSVLPELLSRKSFLSHFCPLPLSLRRSTVLSSFYRKRNVLASLRKLFNSWRKYDTSESTEASVKEHGNAFYPRFWLLFQVARTSYVFVRNRRNHVLHVDDC